MIMIIMTDNCHYSYNRLPCYRHHMLQHPRSNTRLASSCVSCHMCSLVCNIRSHGTCNTIYPCPYRHSHCCSRAISLHCCSICPCWPFHGYGRWLFSSIDRYSRRYFTFTRLHWCVVMLLMMIMLLLNSKIAQWWIIIRRWHLRKRSAHKTVPSSSTTSMILQLSPLLHHILLLKLMTIIIIIARALSEKSLRARWKSTWLSLYSSHRLFSGRAPICIRRNLRRRSTCNSSRCPRRLSSVYYRTL